MSGKTYDVIFDVVGKCSVSRVVRCLNDGGSYLTANNSLPKRIQWSLVAGKGKRRMYTRMAYRSQDLVSLKGMIEAGRLKSVIGRRYPLEEVAEAHKYVDTGQKEGNVVITIA